MTSAFFALSLVTAFAGQDGMVQAPVDPPTAAVGTSVSIDPKMTIEQAADVARSRLIGFGFRRMRRSGRRVRFERRLRTAGLR